MNIEEDESILMVGITLYFADNFQGGAKVVFHQSWRLFPGSKDSPNNTLRLA